MNDLRNQTFKIVLVFSFFLLNFLVFSIPRDSISQQRPQPGPRNVTVVLSEMINGLEGDTPLKGRLESPNGTFYLSADQNIRLTPSWPKRMVYMGVKNLQPRYDFYLNNGYRVDDRIVYHLDIYFIYNDKRIKLEHGSFKEIVFDDVRLRYQRETPRYHLGEVTINLKLLQVRGYHPSRDAEGGQPAGGSNQMAVWIEDENGYYVNSIFVTRLAANKGYMFNPEVLPHWVGVSKWGTASEEEIAAVTGATLQPGDKVFTWDCTDYVGRPVLPGKYTYKIEGNMLFRNIVLYTGSLVLGEETDSSIASKEIFTSARADEAENFILDVSAKFKPAE